MLRVSILLIINLCFSIICKAQVEVSGVVKDHTTQETLPYTSVVILDEADQIVKGTATAVDGSFELQLEPGTYKLEVKFLSYEDYSKSITVADQALDLGILPLKPSTQMLKTLELVEEKAQMQLKIDKREFNVGRDLTTKGGTAAQVLDNIPSVEVDIDGNVSLRGSENVRILIDGKPSTLMGINASNVFDMIPAESIDKVEVITNPSARYDASGEVGIINIVLKKDKVKGLNGVITTRLGTPKAYGGGVQMNYRKNKLNLFGGLSYDYRSNTGSGHFDVHVQNPDTTYYYESRDENLRTGTSKVFRLGADYQFNKQHDLGISGLFQLGTGDDQNNYKYSDFDGNKVLFSKSTRQLNDLEESKGYDLNLNYNFKSKKEGEKLSLQAQASSNFDDEGGTISEIYHLTNRQAKAQRAANDEQNNNTLVQLDYSRPLGTHSKLEAGLKHTSQNLDVNYKVEQQDTTDATWFTLENYHNS
ncbi:MAG: TonB-dependent receptor, partial [Flavobacteriales bacterium]